jgi:hypothetical protein
MHYPTCSACDVSLDCDYDSWTCPKCQTLWDSDASDGDAGELYESWSGETSDAPAVAHGDGWKVPWIEHAYQSWMTDSGYDVGRCRKCCNPKAQHVNGGAS